MSKDIAVREGAEHVYCPQVKREKMNKAMQGPDRLQTDASHTRAQHERRGLTRTKKKERDCRKIPAKKSRYATRGMEILSCVPRNPPPPKTECRVIPHTSKGEATYFMVSTTLHFYSAYNRYCIQRKNKLVHLRPHVYRHAHAHDTVVRTSSPCICNRHLTRSTGAVRTVAGSALNAPANIFSVKVILSSSPFPAADLRKQCTNPSNHENSPDL